MFKLVLRGSLANPGGADRTDHAELAERPGRHRRVSTGYTGCSHYGRAPTCGAPRPEASEYLIRMLQSERDQVAITQQGEPDTGLLGMVSREDLVLSEGAILLRIVEEDMVRAPDIESLARLYAKMETFLAGGLTGPGSLRWLGPIAGAMKAAMLRRVMALTEDRLETDGRPIHGLARCWVFFGAITRNEPLARSPQRKSIPTSGRWLGQVKFPHEFF